jgi:uncharacterized protein
VTATPAIYDARLTHVRRERLHRGFSHRVYLWLVDLAELPELPWWLRPVAGFHARDHLGSPDRTIRENLDAWLRYRGVDLAGGRVLMLANARVLGYVFNPLTVYWCYRPTGELACVVAEVHNTYGERHCYLLRPDDAGRAETGKAFYVSPFLPVAGRYRMRLPVPADRLSVAISLVRDERTVFTATLTGTGRPATRAAILRTTLARPFMPQQVSALIRRHGLALWLRRVPVQPRTPHVHEEGVR